MTVQQDPITIQPLPSNLNRCLHRIKIPKKTGGIRIIYAPQEPLKSFQKVALRDLYKRRIALPASITAYKRNCSAFVNANRHFGYRASIKFDIKNYFDSITSNNIKDALVKENIRDWREISYLLNIGTLNNRMYQGSCLSPFLANLVSKHVLLPKLKLICFPYRLPIFTAKCGDDTCIHFIMTATGANPRWSIKTRLSIFGMEGDLSKCREELERLCTKSATLQYLEGFTDDQLIDMANDSWQAGRTIDSQHNFHYGSTNSNAYKSLPYLLNYPKIVRHRLGLSVITIYSDDVVISSNNTRLNMIKYDIEKTVEKTGFVLNRKKGITVMRSNINITGFNSSNRCKNATTARITNAKIDQDIRRPIHYLKTGKLPVDEKLIRSLVGKISYIKQSNPKHHSKYLELLKSVVSAKTTDLSILKLIPSI